MSVPCLWILRSNLWDASRCQDCSQCSQTAAELSTLISLVDAHMGITILPASAVKHSVAPVVACHISTRFRCLKLVSLLVNELERQS
jgi:DNA-binding transcriptional LysR family regulator